MINIAGQFTFGQTTSPSGSSGVPGSANGPTFGAVNTGTQSVNAQGDAEYDPSEADPTQEVDVQFNGLSSAFAVYNQLLTEASRFELLRCIESFNTAENEANSINGLYAPNIPGDLGEGNAMFQSSSTEFQSAYGYNENFTTGININSNDNGQGYSEFIGGKTTYDSSINTFGRAYLGGQTITIPPASVTILNSSGNGTKGQDAIGFTATFSTDYTPADTNTGTAESYGPIPLLTTLGVTSTDNSIETTDTIVIDLDSNCTTNFEPPGYDATGVGDYHIISDDTNIADYNTNLLGKSVGQIVVKPIPELLSAFSGNTTDFYPMPFIDGDIIQTVFTITSAAGQTNASGTVIGESVTRSVLMQCVLKSSESEFVNGNYEFTDD